MTKVEIEKILDGCIGLDYGHWAYLIEALSAARLIREEVKCKCEDKNTDYHLLNCFGNVKKEVDEEKLAVYLMKIDWGCVDMGTKFNRDSGGTGIRFYKDFCLQLSNVLKSAIESGAVFKKGKSMSEKMKLKPCPFCGSKDLKFESCVLEAIIKCRICKVSIV